MSRGINMSMGDDARTKPYRKYVNILLKHLSQDVDVFPLPSFLGKDGKKMSPIDELLLELQKRSVDSLYISKSTGHYKSVEEKYDWHSPRNLCLEIISNIITDPPKSGWMRTAASDCLAYSFIWLVNTVDIYLYDFKQLRDWFQKEHPKRSDREWRFIIMTESDNHTVSRLVPMKDIPNHIPRYHYLITSTGGVYLVPVECATKEFCESHGLLFEVISNERDAA